MSTSLRAALAALSLSITAACSADGGPLAPPAPYEGYDGVVTVEGRITSGVDGLGVGGIWVGFGYYSRQSSCNGIGCSPGGFSAEARTWTDDDGYYQITFESERCSSHPVIELKATEAGLDDLFPEWPVQVYYQGSYHDVQCQDAPQHIDLVLEPSTPFVNHWRLGLAPAAGQEWGFTISASSNWGLASINVDWGDGSPNSIIPVSSEVGERIELEVFHIWAKPGEYTIEYTVTDILGGAKRGTIWSIHIT